MPIQTPNNLIFTGDEMKRDTQNISLSKRQKNFLKDYGLDEESALKYYQDGNTSFEGAKGGETFESIRLSKKEVQALIDKEEGNLRPSEPKGKAYRMTQGEIEMALKLGVNPEDIEKSHRQHMNLFSKKAGGRTKRKLTERAKDNANLKWNNITQRYEQEKKEKA